MEITQFTLLHPTFGSLSATVPFSVYHTLLTHGKIKDPFYRDNEKDLTALSEEDYTYEGRFTLSKEEASRRYKVLIFEGIDTIADLYLNGRPIGKAENMHRTYEFDASLAVPGENVLRIDFHSPLKYIQEKQARHFTWGQSGTSEGFGHIRKASSMFGWDWAPTLPDMGIYRPIHFLAYDEDRIDDVFIHQDHAAGGKVTLSFAVTTCHQSPKASVTVTLTHPQGEETKIQLTRDKDRLVGNLPVVDPKLWWPRGYGGQPLYTLTFTLTDGQTALDTVTKRIGLRTMTVSTQNDAYGQEFAFVVNGIKIFAMGADYVPEDSLLPRITPERTRKLVRKCCDCNFNAIRVWGGGYYPSNEFYDACDELGLVIWQDFMFACVNVRLSKAMKENLEQEFIGQLKRLRHHASLGLLCGNNEMETAIMNWEGCNSSMLAKSDYLELYERMLPDLCDVYAPDTFYWPSSPSSGGGFDLPDDENRGDAHYWGAWHGSIPFESYRKYYFRFLSEFGFESFPNLKTIRSYSLPEDENPFSPVMEAHQKCLSGNTKILTYLSDKYLYPFDFSQLVYASQLLQLDAIRYGVEHYRRFRGRCMGTIYWQLNDCWPVASWASVDYYGRYKALMYGSRRFFQPVLLSAHENGLSVTLNVSNETRRDFTGTLTYRVIDPVLRTISSEEITVSTPALCAKDVLVLDLSKALQGQETERVLVYELKDEDGQRICASSLLFAKPKAFRFEDPNLQVRFEKTEDPCMLKASVEAKAYAKNIQLDFKTLDGVWSDNYLDMIDDQPRELTVRFETPTTVEAALEDLTVLSVYDIGK